MSERGGAFKKLLVWQRAMDLIDAVTRLVRALDWADRLVYETQVRRAAVSVASALAEGHQRLHTREFQQYAYIARSSLGEVETQLISIGRNCPNHRQDADTCLDSADEIGRMLTRLGEALRRKKPRRTDLGP